MTLRILTFYLPALTLWLTGCGTYAYHTGALRRNLANEEYEQAIENQMMVYNLVKQQAKQSTGEMGNNEDEEENEQTIQALYNLVQIKF